MRTDRRRHRRISVPGDRSPCLVGNSGGVAEPFDVVDLSESGVRIRSPRELAAMTQVAVTLLVPALPGEEARRLETTGVVVWCRRLSRGGFDLGVFFPDLAPPDRDLLHGLVASVA